MYDVGMVGILFIAFFVFFILAVVVYCLFSGSFKDWQRMGEIKNVFKMAVEEIKKDIVELSGAVGDMREALSYEGGGREKKLVVLKSSARMRIESIKRTVNRDLGMVEAFMKDVEAGHALKSLSRSNVDNFKREMMQKQWLIACTKDYLVLLEKNYEQLEVARDDVLKRGENDENVSPVFAFKRVLQKMMKRITEYETTESMKRQEELLRYNRYNQQHHPHHYSTRSPGPSTYYSFQYSSSVPQFNSPRHDYYRDRGAFRN